VSWWQAWLARTIYHATLLILLCFRLGILVFFLVLDTEHHRVIDPSLRLVVVIGIGFGFGFQAASTETTTAALLGGSKLHVGGQGFQQGRGTLGIRFGNGGSRCGDAHLAHKGTIVVVIVAIVATECPGSSPLEPFFLCDLAGCSVPNRFHPRFRCRPRR